jgi:dTDP-4-amino-4,6-dideoxygalactose transaminase
MSKIMELADSHSVPVIEDCAQAFLSEHGHQFVGTLGKIGCFSLQQGKHITTGEGGLVVTNDHALARRMFLFINKAWGYGDSEPDHYFLALNYRMSELQGAVGFAQLPKLGMIVQSRIRSATDLSRKLEGVPGIATPHVPEQDTHSYWKYCLRVDGRVIPGGALRFSQKLKKRQISCAPRYIQKPAFMCRVFQEQNTFGNSRFPFTLARPEILNYNPERFPLTMEALDKVLVLPWNENYTDAHVDYIASSIRDSIGELLAEEGAKP